jgi:hypothetical protein
MVRYSEIINETLDISKAKALLDVYFVDRMSNPLADSVWFEDDTFTVENGRVNISRATCILRSQMKIYKLPIPFGVISENFICADNKLTTLENAPTIVGNSYRGTFNCSNNNLTTLEHMPKRVTGWFSCVANPLISLKGIELDSDLEDVMLSYQPNLPLLRLLVTNHSVEIYQENNHLKFQPNIQDIFNHHIKTYSNIKERIIKCQYALIKAGFKENAKW